MRLQGIVPDWDLQIRTLEQQCPVDRHKISPLRCRSKTFPGLETEQIEDAHQLPGPKVVVCSLYSHAYVQKKTAQQRV